MPPPDPRRQFTMIRASVWHAAIHGLTTMPARWRLRLTAAAVLAAVFLPVAAVRLIDGDEGYLLQAARLVSEGKRPYIDFFFPQAPLVPYVYGAWFALFGRGWISARVLCGVIAVTTGLLLFEYVHRSRRSPPWAFVAIALFALSAEALGWFTVVKTYALGALFLLAAACALQRSSARATLAAGAFVALAASARLYLVVAVPCAVVYLVRRFRGERVVLQRLGLLALGGLVAAAPSLHLLVTDPAAVQFGLVRFHGIREYGQTGMISDLPQKIGAVLGVLLITRPALGRNSLQILLLLVVALAAVVSRLTQRNSFVSYAWILTLLASLLPSPVFPQYFCLIIPLLIIDTVELAATVGADTRRALVGAALAAYGFVGVYEARAYLVTGVGVPGVMSRDRVAHWSLGTVRTVGRLIDAQSLPVGATWWPGYFVETRTEIHRDLVNDFGVRAAARLTPAERVRFHVVTQEEIGAMIRRRSPGLFVEGNWAARPWADWLPSEGYHLVGQTANVRVWVAR